MSDRKGDWLQTFSGKKFFPLDPRSEDICIEDIAHSLSRQCRFAGHVKCDHYSVAQHSVLVSTEVERYVSFFGNIDEVITPRLAALAGLLHDASEAYLVDVPRPLKKLPEFAAYREAELYMEEVIATAFNLPRSIALDVLVRQADMVLLVTEARDLMSPLHPDWAHTPENMVCLEETIVPLGPRESEDLFLSRFYNLVSE